MQDLNGNDKNEFIYKTERFTDLENELIVSSGKDGGTG